MKILLDKQIIQFKLKNYNIKLKKNICFIIIIMSLKVQHQYKNYKHIFIIQLD